MSIPEPLFNSPDPLSFIQSLPNRQVQQLRPPILQFEAFFSPSFLPFSPLLCLSSFMTTHPSNAIIIHDPSSQHGVYTFLIPHPHPSPLKKAPRKTPPAQRPPLP